MLPGTPSEQTWHLVPRTCASPGQDKSLPFPACQGFCGTNMAQAVVLSLIAESGQVCLCCGEVPHSTEAAATSRDTRTARLPSHLVGSNSMPTPGVRFTQRPRATHVVSLHQSLTSDIFFSGLGYTLSIHCGTGAGVCLPTRFIPSMILTALPTGNVPVWEVWCEGAESSCLVLAYVESHPKFEI